MVSLQIYIFSILVLVARSASEFTGTCGPEYGKPPLWDCLVAIHRLSELHPGNPTIRFDAARYEVVRPRARATPFQGPPAPDPLEAARDSLFEEIVLAVDPPSGQIPSLSDIEDLYRPLNTPQDFYEVIETYQARELSIRVSQSQGYSVAEWRPLASLLTESKCDITISWSFPGEEAWHSLDYSNPSWMLILQWDQVIAAANEIKDNCLPRDNGGYGGSIKLGLDNRVQMKLSTYSQSDKDIKEEGGLVEVAEAGKESNRMTRIEAIRDILRKTNSDTLNGIKHILHAQPDQPRTRDGSEANTCWDESYCANTASCIHQQVVNSAVLFGSALIRKAGHCISLPNLLLDFLDVIDAKV